ncbi:carbon-nitrogen hydrolase family protein [Taibaiella koreensis]|uniref:carbon-nitrogen hydrolase family protein n=1 Tax=Taibaiella koreensis TaxID=1268548 RepID=UPI000E5A0952|nr:carbon-nitrogen hydrolase family protein [Taibaiella koreensis]
MKISVAQLRPIKGDISANIEKHKILVKRAVSLSANSIFFPELSITGYEPELAINLATSQDDKIFDSFQEISNTNQITIGLGMPIKTDVGIRIGMIAFQPNAPRQTYAKQQLHADEFPYFVNGEKQIILNVENNSIAPAICYESLQNDHAENANKLGAEIYVASVAKSQNGIGKAYTHYPKIATQYSIPVLMTNSVGYCDNFLSVGQSAVWSKNGQLLAQLNDIDEGIIVFDTETEQVSILVEGNIPGTK